MFRYHVNSRGFSKQIDELKYPPASTPYFNSLELALWTVWILHRSSMFSSFAWSEAECCVYCLGGEGFVSFSSQGLHPSKGLETLMKGGLGDVFVDLFFDDVLRLETCLESSFWPWSLSPIRTPSYTRSLYSLSICFVCGLCVQDSQNSMRVLMGVSRTGYLKCWNRQIFTTSLTGTSWPSFRL